MGNEFEKNVTDSLGGVLVAFIKLMEHTWEFQINVLKSLKLYDFFSQRGWPYIALFFLYGFIFPPLAMLYVISALLGSSAIEQKQKEEELKEMDNLFGKSRDDKDSLEEK